MPLVGLKIILGMYEDKVARLLVIRRNCIHLHLEHGGKQFSTTTAAARRIVQRFLPPTQHLLTGKHVKGKAVSGRWN